MLQTVQVVQQGRGATRFGLVPSALFLGGMDASGVDELFFLLPDEWELKVVRATFVPLDPRYERVSVVLDDTGRVPLCNAVTCAPNGVLVLDAAGPDGYTAFTEEARYSCYRHPEPGGGDPAPTESEWQQLVEQVSADRSAAQSAQRVAAQAAQAAQEAQVQAVDGGILAGEAAERAVTAAAGAQTAQAETARALGLRCCYVTPEMFGAAGDGVTDDRAAFQAMLDSDPGVVVLGDAKTYCLSDGVLSAGLADTIVKGNGSTLRLTRTAIAADQSEIAQAVLGTPEWTPSMGRRAGYVKLYDLNIEGNGAALALPPDWDGLELSAAYHGIRLCCVDEVVLQGCRIHDTFMGGLFASYCGNVFVEGCSFADIASERDIAYPGYIWNGVTVINHENSEDESLRYVTRYLSVRSCVFERVTDVAVQACQTAQVLVEGCTFADVMGMVCEFSEYRYSYHVLNNRCSNTGNRFVSVTGEDAGGGTLRVEGNTVLDMGGAPLRSQPTRDKTGAAMSPTRAATGILCDTGTGSPVLSVVLRANRFALTQRYEGRSYESNGPVMLIGGENAAGKCIVSENVFDVLGTVFRVNIPFYSTNNHASCDHAYVMALTSCTLTGDSQDRGTYLVYAQQKYENDLFLRRSVNVVNCKCTVFCVAANNAAWVRIVGSIFRTGAYSVGAEITLRALILVGNTYTSEVRSSLVSSSYEYIEGNTQLYN